MADFESERVESPSAINVASHLQSESSGSKNHAVIHEKSSVSSSQAAQVSDTLDSEKPTEYLQGQKLWLLTAGIWISLFLSTLETTIVSTSLVSITNALSGFVLRDWIVTSYLLTYTGFLTIYAKFSDVFGRKTMLLLALGIFTLFSALCGISTNIVQLIIFRAFQGIGASGIYSMIMVIAPGLVPPATYGKYMAIVATVFIVASVLGPILGGVINTRSSWHWVFLLNIPGGVISFLLVALYLPMSEASSKVTFMQRLRGKFERTNLLRIDVLGIFLLLASSILLVFSLEEGGTRYPWNSPAIISALVLAILLGVFFVAWETYIEKPTIVQEPVFPPSIVHERLLAAMLCTAFFIGFPFVAVVVNIPQRAQAVSGLSPIHAGFTLLPLLLTSPVATTASGFLTGSLKVPPFYLIMIGSALQLVGVGLTISLPTDTTKVSRAQYGYEAIMGLGFGIGLTTLLTFARAVVSEINLAVMMGAITQLRVLGGTISLSICATILNNYLAPRLESIVGPDQALAISNSLSAVNDLTPAQQEAARKTFAEGYNRQNIFMTVLTGVGLVSACFLWEKKPRKAV